MPFTTEGERRPLNQKEREGIIQVAETHRAGLWVLTMLYCGLRPEETVALMWKDIDLTPNKEVFTVSRAAEMVNKPPSYKKHKRQRRQKGEEKKSYHSHSTTAR